MTHFSPAHHKMLARIMEPVWLQQFLGWRITAPLNDNWPDRPPLGAA